ncbi:Molybdopterin cofactor biosynthesis C domain-containing protein [Colletotrichum navitas]|uniref:cyclic pyranopterin monophosphate synthase n=1 Tax=Colletotrichum navitas TaxID=681940 RepID=A0AAD8Q615_9PEZI|nr:Molybdopterin cofactor biosynthesis C domain-containing protein [Colletotrichum navitas]KAK1595319.1 Molybdopterin cofactor biosynthesis C domain-containing protein [Colletotrichum navitas]
MSQQLPLNPPINLPDPLLRRRPSGVAGVSAHLSPLTPTAFRHPVRLFSSTPRHRRATPDDDGDGDGEEKDGGHPPGGLPALTHVAPTTGSARMVSIASKTATSRVAKAACTVTFSSPLALRLVRASQMKKGDVLGTARVAGIMAAKRTPDLIPLCHPILLSHVGVEVEPASAADGETVLNVEATVECEGKTGVEMEAMTAAAAAALTVYDMCKAVDKGMVVGGLRVVLKDGGKSGRWEMP